MAAALLGACGAVDTIGVLRLEDAGLDPGVHPTDTPPPSPPAVPIDAGTPAIRANPPPPGMPKPPAPIVPAPPGPIAPPPPPGPGAAVCSVEATEECSRERAATFAH